MKLQVDILAGELCLEFVLMNLDSGETSRGIDAQNFNTYHMGIVVWPGEQF